MHKNLTPITATTFLICVGLLAIIGCGGPSDVGGVSGKVTLDGQPLPDANVTFSPTKEGGSSSLARTDSEGYYEMTYTGGYSGAQLGENKVTISTYDEGNPDGDPPRPPVPEKVPAKYNAKTELKADVKPGSNTFDWDLKGGAVVNPAAASSDDSKSSCE